MARAPIFMTDPLTLKSIWDYPLLDLEKSFNKKMSIKKKQAFCFLFKYLFIL